MDKLFKAKKRPIPVRIWKEDFEKEIVPIMKEYEEIFGKSPSIPLAINIKLKKIVLRKKDEKEEKYKIF